MAARPLRLADIATFGAVLLLLGGVGEICSRFRAERARELEANLTGILATANADARHWRAWRLRSARVLARLPALREALQRAPLGSRHWTPLPVAAEDPVALLEPGLALGGFDDFAVLTREGLCVAASAPSLVGSDQIGREVRGVLHRAEAEGAALTPAKLTALWDAAGAAYRSPTMYAVAPIAGPEARPAGYLALRFDPEATLDEALAGGGRDRTTESFAFDAEGMLLTSIHDDRPFRDAGLVGPGRESGLRVRLVARDSAVPRTFATNDGLPTPVLLAATTREGGADLTGYRNHEGRRTVGAWTWDAELGLGLATEMDEERAHATVAAQDGWVVGIAGAAWALLAALAFLWRRAAGRRDPTARSPAPANEELERRIAERTAALEATSRLLTEAREAGERANQAKSSFLANTSHELLTPLNALIGMTELARDGGSDPRRRDLQEKALEAARNLADGIRDVLDFSSIEARRSGLTQVPFDLLAVLGEVRCLLGPKAAEKGLSLRFSVEPAVPRRLVGDPGRLAQVLLNLVGNAVKFTDEGEVGVAVAALAGVSVQPRLRFEVWDTGIGIAPDGIARLFGAFSTVDTTATRRFSGLGLGLAMVRELVRLMNGRAWATSEPGQGSTFSFTAEFSALGHADDAGTPLTPGVGGYALLVTAEPATESAMATALGCLGFAVTSTATRAAALAAAGQAPPDTVAFVDAERPDRAGSEVACELAVSDGSRSGLPTLLLASRTAGLPHRGVVEAGVVAVLPKPIDPWELLGALPGAQTRHGERPAKAGSRRHSRGRGQERPRVLVAEDHELGRQILAELLRQEGVDVALAEDGRAAGFATQKDRYDLILMDVRMPGIDGLAATRTIRREGACCTTPIIAITANSTDEDRRACLDAGMDDHLAKPVDRQALLAMLERWLPRGRLASPRTAGAPATTGTDEDLRTTPNAAPKAHHDRPAPAPSSRRWPGATNETKTGDSFAAIEYVNSTWGEEHTGGNVAFYREILQGFVQRIAAAPHLLTDQLSAGDLEGAALEVHTLKGLAGAVGAEPLAAIARQLEAALERDGPERREALIARLEFTVQKTLAAAAVILAPNGLGRTANGAATPSSAPPPSREGRAQPAAAIHDLLEQLAQSRFVDRDGLMPAREALRGTIAEAEWTEVETSVMTFEYERAMVTLGALAERLEA